MGPTTPAACRAKVRRVSPHRPHRLDIEWAPNPARRRSSRAYRRTRPRASITSVGREGPSRGASDPTKKMSPPPAGRRHNLCGRGGGELPSPGARLASGCRGLLRRPEACRLRPRLGCGPNPPPPRPGRAVGNPNDSTHHLLERHFERPDDQDKRCDLQASPARLHHSDPVKTRGGREVRLGHGRSAP